MLNIKELVFSYPKSNFEISIPSLDVKEGESLAITGPSGSGKTTLLNLISGILQSQSGEIRIGKNTISKMKEDECRAYRISQIGMLFQGFELLEYLSVYDNILLPYRLEPTLRLDEIVYARATELTSVFGISDKLKKYPSQLSQGERQRVALCRALITGAKLIIADEPTGNLDPKNTTLVADMFLEYLKKEKATLITVTHDQSFAKRFDRQIDFMQLLQERKDV